MSGGVGGSAPVTPTIMTALLFASFKCSQTHVSRDSHGKMWIWNQRCVPSGRWCFGSVVVHLQLEGNQSRSVGDWQRRDTARQHLVSVFNATGCSAEALIRHRCLPMHAPVHSHTRSRSLARHLPGLGFWTVTEERLSAFS